ncbi:MAG: MOSC domain-containing protein [Planctomycetia bacterium]|nr:MOSC domain-containing protein [Planctomycetia bacterium]
MTSTPRVVSIVYTPRDIESRRPQSHYARVPLQLAKLVEFQGIENDAKGGSTDRQLNVMRAEMLADLNAEGFKTAPGELGEQIVLAGLDPSALVKGARLKLGTAVIEIGIPRTGCARFEMIQDKPKQQAKGRLGVLARVVTSGEVAVGDAVDVLAVESRG